MKTDLDHLPGSKRREIEKVLGVLFDEMEQENQLKSQQWKRRRRILKVILFGSYARGDWVRGNPVNGYQSDYDLLVIVSHQGLVEDRNFIYRTEERLMNMVRTPVNFIVHTLAEVNGHLKRGQFFFVDIKKDGVALFESKGGKPLAVPGNLPPEVALDVAREHYENWFPNAEEFLFYGGDALNRGWNKKAAFFLHQTTECLYATNLLVLTNYMPNTHNIRHLRSLTESCDRRFIEIFPRHHRRDKRCFELLRDAYVKARYSKHYKITGQQLDWLKERVERLRQLTGKICRGRIDQLAGKAGN